MITKLREEHTVKAISSWRKGNFKADLFIDKEYWLENFNKVK